MNCVSFTKMDQVFCLKIKNILENGENIEKENFVSSEKFEPCRCKQYSLYLNFFMGVQGVLFLAF